MKGRSALIRTVVQPTPFIALLIEPKSYIYCIANMVLKLGLDGKLLEWKAEQFGELVSFLN